MLPSTGYFKGINCPFYDSGFCERPYCHFRHVKKDSQTLNNDEITSGTIFQKLVSAAVQKVLQQTETGASPSLKTVESTESCKKSNNVQTLLPKPTYNPTPIAELNKINNNTDANNDDGKEQKRKHIPVPYTPRKPASIPVKRPVDSNGCNLFTYIPPAKYTPGSVETTQPDPYTPKGSKESNEKYLPGIGAELQDYNPNDTQTSKKLNYVPSDKSTSKTKLLEYKPAKVVKSQIPSVTYKPTPRSLAPCFSSDDEEPDVKKVKLSSDLNGLDELGAEFDILDQILDEENSEKQSKTLQKKDDENGSSILIKTSDKTNNIRKNVEDKKERLERHSHKKHDNKDERKSKSQERRSSHKSTHRDKVNNDKERDKSRTKEKDKTRDKEKDKNRDKEKDKTKDKEKDKAKAKEKDKTKTRSEKKSRNSDSESKHSKSALKDSKYSKDLNRKHERSHKSHQRSKEKKEEKHKKRKESSTTVLSDNDDTHDADRSDILDVDDADLSESDEEAIALECKRIFEEYVPVEQSVSGDTEEYKPEKSDEFDEYVPGKKRISRTIDKSIKVVQKPQAKPDYKTHARQAMADRLTKVREYHASRNAINTTTPKCSEKSDLRLNVTKSVISAPTSGSSKIRIAHVPYASTMMNAKRTISAVSASQPLTVEPSTSTTIVQTVKKGSQRVAHMPSEKFIDRPGVLEPLAAKIPANIRSTYLNMMIDHCLKIYLAAEDAYSRAQHEELTTSKKCSTIPIYKNSAVLTISRLKKEIVECNGIKKSGYDCNTSQKMPQTVSSKGTAGSWSIENKNRNTVDSDQLCGVKLFKNISKWILTEEELKENGFPRPHTSGERGRAMIHKQKKQTPPKGYFRTCCRCKKDYTIDKKGFPVIKEECIYHPNNKYRIRGEVRYQCCSQDGFSDGCCIASCHVYEYVDYDNLKGYVKTLAPESVQDDYGVYALDCEMCYTTQGLDLTRITVINSACKVVYETLVRPLHPIIDYNTRYSGITEEQMLQVKTTLLEVQATLLTMFSSKTILIGHSLESDFKALKLIHDTIIDTSVLYPHKMGPPYKRALRNLSSEYLKKIIQNSVDGHDSAEDATVCMELILYKLKEDLKTR